MQQLVAKLLRLGEGVLAVQEQGPGEQVDADQGQFEPGGVDGEVAGWEPAEAAVLATPDAVLDAGVAAVAWFEQLYRAGRPRTVGDEHLMASALDGVEQAELGGGLGPAP